MLSFSVVFVCLQQQTETRIQMIKMVNEFKLTVVHFARPNPMQICACAWIYRWTEKPWKMRSELPGLWASWPPGRRAVAGRGPLGLWAAGPLGHGGPWAAGLLLAKPLFRANDTQRNDRTEQQLLIIPTGWRQTSWLFTSAARKLNQGLPGSNSTSGQSRS